MHISPKNAHCIQHQGRYFFALAGASRYFISPCGALLSMTGGKPELLTPSPQTKGYLQTGIRMDDGTYKRVLIHRLVAQRFLPPPDSAQKKQVDHLDSNRKNNAADNLEYVTNRENSVRARLRALAKTQQAPDSTTTNLKIAA